MTDSKPKQFAGRAPGGKLTKPELIQVGRKLRKAALQGDVNAALTLSIHEFSELLKNQQAAA